jgi:hypothetical protein
MPPFTIYSILGDISLGQNITEILGSVRSRNGKLQWPEQSLLSYIYPMKLTCQYPVNEYMATIQVIQRNSTGAKDSLAGYLRVWRWVAENPNDNCRSFSLIIVAIWLQATSRSLWIADRMRNFRNLS